MESTGGIARKCRQYQISAVKNEWMERPCSSENSHRFYQGRSVESFWNKTASTGVVCTCCLINWITTCSSRTHPCHIGWYQSITLCRPICIWIHSPNSCTHTPLWNLAGRYYRWLYDFSPIQNFKYYRGSGVYLLPPSFNISRFTKIYIKSPCKTYKHWDCIRAHCP